jgi:hypothetical protein
MQINDLDQMSYRWTTLDIMLDNPTIDIAKEKHTTSVILSWIADLQRRHHDTHCPHLGVHAILVARAIPKIAHF